MFKNILKFGELSNVSMDDIQTAEHVISDPEINSKFLKAANMLKKLTPKAEDFLYFSTRYITAAEASLLNADGSSKLDRDGNKVTAKWESDNNGKLKWVCSDSTVFPYKNQNGDIFPESELLKAHKNWISRPLCVDHKSDSVDAVRGIIIDSYYDYKHKYAVALIALDKISFPELARGIQSGYKTSVSMGTRVGAAICFDCGQKARSESEFCHHMKTKSHFGEINTELDPIEISIVVTGADPQAKIRTILASYNQIKNSLEEKEAEINKISMSSDSLSKFKELEDDIKKISEKLSDLKSNLDAEDRNNSDTAAYGQTGNLAISEDNALDDNTNLVLSDRFASNNNVLRSELEDLKKSVSSKFAGLEQSLTILSHKIKEENMSVNSKDGLNKEGYFQGAGGANEPTPHQVRYPKEPLNEQLRNSGDKHMLETESMGPVDGMFPGDKEKKELVQRAELEERSLRRAAALQKAKENLMKSKEAYFQGGGEGNEPKPGKVQYPIDPINEKARKEDKHMVGKKPFPDVGDVDGLYPEDLKKKELLQRASLKARFLRVASEDGTQDLAQSAWEVTRDNDPLFTATVEEISGGNVEGLYDVIASKSFGEKLLKKVQQVGVKKAEAIYKGAQAVTGMGPLPSSPVDTAPGAAAPAMSEADMAPSAEPAGMTDMDAKGDASQVALKLATEMRDHASDLLEAVRVLTGEQAEMGDLDSLTEKAAELKPLVRMKKTISAKLLQEMKQVVASLSASKDELELISDVISGDASISNSSPVMEALSDAQVVIAKANELKESYVKYAAGSAQLVKQAQMLADKADEAKADEAKADEAKVEDMAMSMDHDMSMVEDPMVEDEAMIDDNMVEATDDEDMNQVMMDVDPNSLQGKKVEIKAAGLDLSTKEARAQLRAKLAAQSVEFSPILDQSAKLSDGQTALDVKPSDNLGKVETIEEQHDAILEIAEAPPKVRKEAARLNELILAKKVAKTDLDKLVSQGLDASVVKYWKQFYGEAGKEGSEFATELLKEHAKAQIDEEINAYKVKVSRAYDLTNEMVRRGLIADDRAAITAHVEDVITWNDEGFEAMKRVVNKHQLRKAASFPQVGIIGGSDPSSKSVELSLQDELDKAFSSRRY